MPSHNMQTKIESSDNLIKSLSSAAMIFKACRILPTARFALAAYGFYKLGERSVLVEQNKKDLKDYYKQGGFWQLPDQVALAEQGKSCLSQAEQLSEKAIQVFNQYTGGKK